MENVNKDAGKSVKDVIFENRDIGINGVSWTKNGFRNYSISHYNMRLRSWSNLRLDADPKQIDCAIEALEAIKDDLLKFNE